MAYTVRFQRGAERDFRRLPREIQQRLRPRLAALGDDPRPSGVKAISGARFTYRIRMAEYRVIYEVHDEAVVVLVIAMGHRREVYEHYRRRIG